MNKEIDLVIVGDIAFEKDITKHGVKVSKGGSGYYSSIGASKYSNRVGLVSRVGGDFELTELETRGINTKGVQVVENGKTARFTVYHNEDGSREFEAERGTAEEFSPTLLIKDYQNTKHVHFSTSLPQRYVEWMEFLNQEQHINAAYSIDTFESFATDYPEETKLAISMADIIFMNEDEMNIMRAFGYADFTIPTIIKYGKRGAEYRHYDTIITAVAPQVEAVDTTGAGDVLAGAFLAQRVQNVSLDASLVNAVNLASQSVSDFGVDHL